MIDSAQKNNWFIEVNWKEYDESTNNCKVLKITFPDGKEAYLDKKLLIEMLFAVGTSEEQRKMIPQVIRHSRWYETTISIKATKDIRKGESITFPLKLTLPTVEEEVIAEMKRDSGIIKAAGKGEIH